MVSPATSNRKERVMEPRSYNHDEELEQAFEDLVDLAMMEE